MEPCRIVITYLVTNHISPDRKKKWNNLLYLIASSWVKVQQQQHKLKKAYKLMEIEQLSTESPVTGSKNR